MEKRRFSRVDFTVKALVAAGDTAFRGEVDNLSLHGIFIKTDQRLPLGTEVDITIGLAEVEPEIVIHVQATVARHTEEGIGFEFGKIDVDSFTHLRSIISYRKGDADVVMDEFINYVERKYAEER